jgi:uncharacterized protein YeaO (DUF488 family)
MITLKRVYEPPDSGDGFRVLVERLWPRGITKEHAHLDLWLKEIAPSSDLRKWFAHDPSKWDEFSKRYRTELITREELVMTLLQKSRETPVTLIFAARDLQHNSAVILKQVVEEKMQSAQ